MSEEQDYGIRKEDFGEGFTWGVSTSAYQIEGAHDRDGKGPSIWDVFTNKAGGETGNIACDFYHRYPQDLDIMHSLGIRNFRLSLAWTRIFPAGSGPVNRHGIDFYNRLIDACVERDIQPWITLYHWDLPHELEKRGGWTNRETVGHFADYAGLCAREFGDRVRHWMVLNEPMVFTGCGYLLGMHAPGRRGLKNFLPALHHVALAQAEGGRALRSFLPPGAQVGTTNSCTHFEALQPNEKDLLAVRRVDALINRLFVETALGMGYPVGDFPKLDSIGQYFMPGDENLLPFDFDFWGLHNYTREIIRHSSIVPFINAGLVWAKDRGVPMTEMKWEIYPEAMYAILKKFSAYPGIRKIIITENGAAFPDEPVNGRVADGQRTAFLRENLRSVLRAKAEGAPVEGYFVWSLLDNFEWAEGYRPRFGLIYVDYRSQERIIKDSAHWYSRLINP